MATKTPKGADKAEPKRYADASAAFKRGDLTFPVGDMTVQLIDDNDQDHEPLGKAIGVVPHWSAGTYAQAFNGYHFQIVYNPVTKKAYVVKCLPTTAKGQHLWGRNSGFFAVSFAAMRGASEQHHGKYPVTPEQMELAAQLIAELCAWKGINPAVKVTVPELKMTPDQKRLVPTGKSVQVPTISDHALFARMEYPKARWDIGPFYPKLYDRVQVIYRELKGQKKPDGTTRAFEFEEIL
jgi:hypothetical protein